MSNETLEKNQEENSEELVALKKRADVLGIGYHPNIGLEKLRIKVDLKLEEDVPKELISTPSKNPVKESIVDRNKRLRNAAAKLIRIRIVCMNPNKKEHAGEVITCSNTIVGTFKKYVPFGNEEGWHVPQIIYNYLRERKCQVFVTKRDARGNQIKKGKLINEFAIEVLPDLTTKELKDLASKQAMARTIDE